LKIYIEDIYYNMVAFLHLVVEGVRSEIRCICGSPEFEVAPTGPGIRGLKTDLNMEAMVVQHSKPPAAATVSQTCVQTTIEARTKLTEFSSQSRQK